MDLSSGRAFWPLKDGQPHAYPPLRQDEQCDVLVVGGGISGALIAHALAHDRLDVVVVDRRDVATGSTAASTSLLQYEPDAPLHRLIEWRGETNAVACFRACRQALEEIGRFCSTLGSDCRFERRRSLQLASREAHVSRMRRELALREKHGFAIDWWSRDRLAQESSLPHAAALYTPDAAVVDAYALTHALLHDATKRGLRIFARTDIVRFTSRRGGWRIATDRGGTIRAQRVVIASGYEAHRVLRQKWGTLHSTYALATMPLPAFPGWPDSCLLWETAKPYFYARQTHDGRAVFGGYDEDFSDERRRDAMLTAKTAALLRKLRSLFPALDAETAYAWTGTFAETPDSLPYIGPVPGRPGMWAALGYGGNGVIFSTLARQIIREQMQEGRHPLEELFSFERPSRRSS